jgi:hypothetical protein
LHEYGFVVADHLPDAKAMDGKDWERGGDVGKGENLNSKG